MKYTIGWILLFLLVMFGTTWVVEGNNFFIYKVFAPREEAVRRQVFEQSKAYNEGMAQELSQMQLDYIKANPEQKQALRSIILHRYARYNKDMLSTDLRSFLDSL